MATTAQGTTYVESSDLVSAYPTASLAVANAIDAKASLAMTQNAQTGTSYTAALTDGYKLVTMSNAAANTFTVPPQSSVTWVSGQQLRVLNLGAGVTTITPGAGVTIGGSPLLLPQHAGGVLIRTAADTWTFMPIGTSATGLRLVASAAPSAAAAVNINGCFTSDHANYLILIDSVAASGTPVLNYRLRAASTDDTSANYTRQYLVAGAGTVVGNRVTGQTAGEVGYTGASKSTQVIHVFAPQLASATTVKSEHLETVASPGASLYYGGFTAATQFDGISIYPASSTFTGTIRVYGYANS